MAFQQSPIILMQDSNTKNAFNDSLGYLGRINNLFYEAWDNQKNLKYYDWLLTLIGIYKELSTQVEIENRGLYLTEIYTLFDLVRNPYILVNNSIQLRQDIFFRLLKFELSLRDIWHKAGFDMKTTENQDKRFGM